MVGNPETPYLSGKRRQKDEGRERREGGGWRGVRGNEQG